MPYFMVILYDQPLTDFYETPTGSKVVEKNDVVIAGRKATKYLIEIAEVQMGFNVGDKITRIIIKDEASWLGIELFDPDQEKVFDQILFTFKFLN